MGEGDEGGEGLGRNEGSDFETRLVMYLGQTCGWLL